MNNLLSINTLQNCHNCYLSLSKVIILCCLDVPRSISEIIEITELSRRTVERFCTETEWITKVSVYDTPDGLPGRPTSYKYIRSAATVDFLEFKPTDNSDLYIGK